MTTYSGTIEAALPTQADLAARREHCAADGGELARIGRGLGHQVRVVRSATAYGLFTVSELNEESRSGVVRIGQAGLWRIEAVDGVPCTVSSQVVHPTYSEAEAQANSELVERLSDDGSQSKLIAIAPHGGAIEPFTDAQAERVGRGLDPNAASSWRCKGWKAGGGAHARWHIASADIHEASFPLLAKVIGRGFAHAVSFHGCRAPGILVGGLAPDAIKQAIKEAIQAVVSPAGIAVRVAAPGEDLGGSSPKNLVNRLTADGESGVQIEQGYAARSGCWQAIADAVAGVYNRLI